jgi:hypothetical protein
VDKLPLSMLQYKILDNLHIVPVASSVCVLNPVLNSYLILMFLANLNNLIHVSVLSMVSTFLAVAVVWHHHHCQCKDICFRSSFFSDHRLQ